MTIQLNYSVDREVTAEVSKGILTVVCIDFAQAHEARNDEDKQVSI